MNETEYVDYLVKKYEIEPVVFHMDQKSVTDREELIRVERDAYSRGERLYRKQIVTYHIPFSGDPDLLQYAPSNRIMWTMEIMQARDYISFDVVNWSDDPKQITQEANSNLSNLERQAANVVTEVTEFNNNLEKIAFQIVQSRKAEYLKQSNILAELGVPVRKADSVPSTFIVPTVKKNVIVKPSAPDTPFSPDPTLDPSVYEEILRICHETGIEMERHPNIYSGKDEETLRDHFIMVLSPHFQSVTGQTFNKSGKTDILIRHEKSNVFVAECKFWKGIKGLHETIDQVLSYLTWRDSKAAVLCFVKTKELSSVLAQIESDTAKHACFVKYHGKKSESWFNFDFHLVGDNARRLRLSVLCFHFPPLAQKIVGS